MVAKVPIRTVYTGASATGLAEFQSGEFIDYVVGGTGLVALGTANQVLATNSAATAIEWQAPTTGDITGVTAGTGLTGGGNQGVVELALDTGINATYLANGSVTNTELQYINSLSSNAQTQITNVKTTADAAASKAFAIAQAVALG